VLVEADERESDDNMQTLVRVLRAVSLLESVRQEASDLNLQPNWIIVFEQHTVDRVSTEKERMEMKHGVKAAAPARLKQNYKFSTTIR